MCLGALTHLIYLKHFLNGKMAWVSPLAGGGEGWRGETVTWEMRDLFRAGTLWAQAEVSI